MLRNPSLAGQARNQLQMQLNQLTAELEQAKMIQTLAQAALAMDMAGIAGGGMNMGGPMNGMGVNGMNMGMGGGMGVPGMMGGPMIGGMGPMQMQMPYGGGMHNGPMVNGIPMMNGGGMIDGSGNGGDFGHQQWNSAFSNQQPASSDSAYQRLPVNNRRRALKRERPSDFVEVGGDGSANKVARYWE